MDICHVYKFEKDAIKACNDFLWDCYNSPNIETPKIFKDHRCKCIIGTNIHWFLSEYRYETWCKGRDYILNGQLMHSGYPVMKDEWNEYKSLIEIITKDRKENNS